ncbi:MAG: ATP-binding protein [Polyangiaceae bacterium]
MVTTMLLTGIVSLSAVGYLNYVVEGERLEDIKNHIESAVSGKAATLVASQALALRGLVSDNVFSDVRVLVANAVHQDPDVTYGFFVASDENPWAYVSPTHPKAEEPVTEGPERLLIEGHARAPDRLSDRRLRVFGEEIHEFSAPVLADDGQRLGMVVYGFSNKRMQRAVSAAAIRSRTVLTRGIFSAAAVGLFSLGVGIAWVLRSAARVTKPLAGLTSAVNEIAAGNRQLRVQIQSGDEVEVLASAFNQMLEANEEAMQKLEATTERALAADRMKSEFLANTSHEIRTPMNGVLGMLRLIRQMPLNAKLRRYVDTIDTSANALLTIINDILDFSKMEAGKYTLQSVPFEPNLVLQDVAELLASRAHDKKLDLIVRADPNLPEPVQGDPDRFRQVLNNLIGNAIKFTDRGEVFVHARLAQHDSDSALIEVEVRDTGIGIEADDLPKLYKAFSQVDGSMLRRHGGTGLGLAISQRLAHMMGGAIRVQSKAGEGSTFTFSARFQLPVETTERRQRPDSSHARRVLLMEANPRWCEAIEEQLGAWNIRATSVTDTLGAERALAAQPAGDAFDALILSAASNDPSLSRVLAALENLGRPPFVLLSPLGSEASRAEPPYAPLAQLTKPLRYSDLRAALDGTLAGNSERALHRADPTGIHRPSTRRPILIVDDNDVNRFVAVEELNQYGYLTEEAENGAEALQKVSEKEYLCVLMDCQMPTMDGYDATRAIRALEQRESRLRTPIIALTAHALVGERERVLAAGMDDFLSKPFRPTSLEKLLQRHARRSAAPPQDTQRDLDPNVKRSEKLIRLFLERMPEQLAQLEGAFQKGDAPQVRSHAHRIKGSALALAAERLSESAEALQRAAETGSLQGADVHLRRLMDHYQTVATLLGRELVLFQEVRP